MAIYPELMGRAAIVTMASQGMGAEIARSFARNGARVAITSRSLEKLQPVAAEIAELGGEPLPIQVDPSVRTQVNAAVETVLKTFGQIDLLVNTAGGFFRPTTFLEIPEEEWDFMLDLNLKSVFLWMQAVLPAMIERRSGRIINFGSTVGRGVPASSIAAHYAAAKAGVINLSRHVASEVGPLGIAVNVVSPGTTATPAFAMVRGPANQAEVIQGIPLRRLATPADQAAAVLFLASDGASYITGANLDVNGGRLMV